MEIQFVKYTEEFLHYSSKWLSDPEIKRLTMTPDIDKSIQLAWFKNLETRTDYFIKGVMVEEMPIGAVGIKYIDFEKGEGEYWGYIGNKNFIGKGIGKYMVSQMCLESKKMGLKKLVLHVAEYNVRAYQLYIQQGFNLISKNNGIFKMEKILEEGI